MKKSGNFINILVLLAVSIVFLIAGNGILHLTDPDEVFYAETAKEMIHQKTWLVPYLFGEPQFEKPILTFWLMRIGYIIFGISSFSARLFPALFAIVGAFATYFLSIVAYNDKKKAFISFLILISSGLYIGLARAVMTDMIFAVFISLSLVSFFYGYTDIKKKSLGINLFFLFSGLAVLTKGPLGIILPISAIFLFLAIRKDLKFLFCKHSILGLLIFIVATLPWYWFMINKFGESFINEFFYNDHIRRLFEAEHRSSDTWYSYPATMLGCMFPWSILVFAALLYLAKKIMEKHPSPLYLFLLCWISTTFIICQAAHSKLVSYIFPFFPALAVITGDFICSSAESGRRWSAKLLVASLCILTLVPAVLIIAGKEYMDYLPSRAFLYWFIFCYLALVLSALFLTIKRRWLAGVCLTALLGPLVLIFAFLGHKSVDNYATSYDTSEYLLKNYVVQNKIICSKPLARGIKFFTDKDVAVMDINGSGYFSPHPITYLNAEEKLMAFLTAQKVTYGIFTDSSFEDINRLSGEYKFTLNVLKVIGNQYIVKIQR